MDSWQGISGEFNIGNSHNQEGDWSHVNFNRDFHGWISKDALDY